MLVQTAAIKTRKISVEEYYKMAESGILKPEEQVELIHGEIVEMSPINSFHTSIVKKLNLFFSSKLIGRNIIGIQDPINLGAHSEPEPDISILKFRDDFYEKNHPRASDILLIIEVADSSLQYDQEVKAKLYAEAGIEHYWIFNLQDRSVIVYSEIEKGQYQSVANHKGKDVLKSEKLNLSLPVDHIFA